MSEQVRSSVSTPLLGERIIANSLTVLVRSKSPSARPGRTQPFSFDRSYSLHLLALRMNVAPDLVLTGCKIEAQLHLGLILMAAPACSSPFRMVLLVKRLFRKNGGVSAMPKSNKPPSTGVLRNRMAKAHACELIRLLKELEKPGARTIRLLRR
jgi:hypothetical protein